MPHVIVKMWPGESEQQKKRLAEAITKGNLEKLSNLVIPAEAGIHLLFRDNKIDPGLRLPVRGRTQTGRGDGMK